MLNNILTFFQDNSFILGTVATIVWYFQQRSIRMSKKITTMELKISTMQEKFIEMEEKRIVTLERKFDHLMETQGDLKETVMAMKASIEHAAKGVTRIENILLSAKYK